MSNQIKEYAEIKQELCRKNDEISNELYEQYGVNRGLRDINGKGVLTGLTTISQMVSFKKVDGVETPCDGELWYRGYNAKDLVAMCGEHGFGFERTAYLLIFGEMPTPEQTDEFKRILGDCRCHDQEYSYTCVLRQHRAVRKLCGQPVSMYFAYREISDACGVRLPRLQSLRER